MRHQAIHRPSCRRAPVILRLRKADSPDEGEPASSSPYSDAAAMHAPIA